MEQVEGIGQGGEQARTGLAVTRERDMGWHRPLQLVLAAHVPLLLAFALLRDVDPLMAVLWLALPAVLAALAGVVARTGAQTVMVAFGLAWCSWLLVVWSGGAVEAHLHGLIVIGLVGLYRDWVALVVIAVAMAGLHLGPGLAQPELVRDHPAALAAPLPWALASLLAVVAAAGLVLLTWRAARTGEEAVRAHAASHGRVAHQQRHQEELAAVYATAARRNQGLLERQLQVIEHMEAEESDPATLQQLFLLDHLTTRMSREATSMLVLAGGEPTRRVTGTPPVSEVVRGAVGEIEDYTRVELVLADDREVEGRLVASLVHILSELVENAATYSPPDEQVRVVGATTADGGYRLHIIDRGIGLDDARLHQYNELLARPPGVAPRDNQRLGLDVVARLAGRHALPVQLSHNTDGRGVSATVHIPPNLLSPAADDTIADAEDVEPMPTPAAPGTSPLVDEALPVDVVTVDAAPSRAASSPVPRPAPAIPRPAPGTGVPTAAVDPRSAPPVAPAVARPAAPSRPDAIHATARSATSWSYGGHLQRRPDPVGKGPDADRTRRFGRGSRSQVAGMAPRSEGDSPAGQAPAKPSDPWAHEPIPRAAGTPSLGGRASAPTGRPPGDPAAGAGQAADPSPATSARPQARAATPPAAAGPSPGGAGSVGPTAARASSAGDTAATDPSKRNKPTAMELLAGIGETSDRAAEWEAASGPVNGPVGLGRGQAAGSSGTSRRTIGAGPGDAPSTPSRPTVGREASPQTTADAPAGAPGDTDPIRAPGPAAASDDPGSTAAHAGPGSSAVPAGAGSSEATGGSSDATGGSAAATAGMLRGDTDGPLPQRRRGESLPPGLRGDTEEQPQRSASAAPVSREESRSLLSSYQSRLQAGRRAAEDQVARTRPTSSPEDDPSSTDGDAGPDDAR